MRKRAQSSINSGIDQTFSQAVPGSGGRPAQGQQQQQQRSSPQIQQPQQQRTNQTQQTLAHGQRAQPGQVPSANQPQPQPQRGQQEQQQPDSSLGGGFGGGLGGILGSFLPQGEAGFGQIMGMLMPHIQPLLGLGFPAILALQQLYRGITGGFQNNPYLLFQKTSARRFGEKLGHEAGQRLQMRPLLR